MKVHVVLTNNFKKEDLSEIDINNSICAVIDTIRASSTIVTMLGCGANSVLIAESKKEAFELKKIFPDHVLCGEEGGLAPEGFDYGNSPVEISRIDARSRDFILMTTNGTRSLLRASAFKDVFVLSILNLNHVLDAISVAAKIDFCDILLLCSGEHERIAYDDAYNAGLAIKYLLTRPYNFDFTDSARLVLSVALSEFDINDALEKSRSAKALREVSSGEDIAFLSQPNIYDIAPRLIRLHINEFQGKAIDRKALKKTGKDYLYLIRKSN